MAKKKKKKKVRVGDIVEVIDDSFGPACGCTGEVVEVGRTIKVAVVLMLSLDRDQLKKKVDLAALSWKALRKHAKKLDIPARAELEAKIKQQLMERGRCELPGVANYSPGPGAKGDSYSVIPPIPMADEPVPYVDDYAGARTDVQSVGDDDAAPVRRRGASVQAKFRNGWIVKVVDEKDKYCGATGPVINEGPDPVVVVLTPCPKTRNKTLRNQEYKEWQLEKSS